MIYRLTTHHRAKTQKDKQEAAVTQKEGKKKQSKLLLLGRDIESVMCKGGN